MKIGFSIAAVLATLLGVVLSLPGLIVLGLGIPGKCDANSYCTMWMIFAALLAMPIPVGLTAIALSKWKTAYRVAVTCTVGAPIAGSLMMLSYFSGV